VKFGIPRETVAGENRVAVIPKTVKSYVEKGHEILIESGAGSKAGFADSEYEDAGATILKGADKIFSDSDVIVKVNRLAHNSELGRDEVEMLSSGKAVIGLLDPLNDTENIEKLVQKNVTVFSMEFLPRITRAQSMDVLSSMSTIAGYKAVLQAAEMLPKFFPLLMTAAGTIPPANVLVIGAGVAGLQAIATAKRLGGKVSAFDTRPVVREQVESLGARFIEMDMDEDAETEGGYAKEISEEFYKRELEVIGEQAKRSDVIITTALIFGKKAPILVTESMLKEMQAGSVVVDLAGVNGGNCELAEPEKTVVQHDVTLHTPLNLPATLPYHASQMYSKNVSNFVAELFQDDSTEFDFKDQVVNDTCIIRDGEIVNQLVQNAIQGKGA